MICRAALRTARCARVRFQSTLITSLGVRRSLAASRMRLASDTDCNRTVMHVSPWALTSSGVTLANTGTGSSRRICAQTITNCAAGETIEDTCRPDTNNVLDSTDGGGAGAVALARGREASSADWLAVRASSATRD